MTIGLTMISHETTHSYEQQSLRVVHETSTQKSSEIIFHTIRIPAKETHQLINLIDPTKFAT
jgi:hypothetical protein